MRICIQKPANRYASDFKLTVGNKIYSEKKMDEFNYVDTYNRGNLDTLNYLSTNVDMRKIITKIPGVFKNGLKFRGTLYNSMDQVLEKYTTYDPDKDVLIVKELIKARMEADVLFTSVLHNLYKQFKKSLVFLYIDKSTGNVRCAPGCHSYFGVIKHGVIYNGFNVYGRALTAVYNEFYVLNLKRKRH